jgi:ribosome biogenesis GTPase
MSSSSNHERTLEGTVYKKNIQSYTVWSEGKSILCALSARFWKPERSAKVDKRKMDSGKPQSSLMDSIAVGDRVRILDSQDGTGRILEVLPRRSQLSRRSPVPTPGKHASEQVIVSNVDQVIPVFAAANPEPHWNMLDRYLVTAESFAVPAVICITKTDLLDAAAFAAQSSVWDEYRQIGYTVLAVSSFDGSGLDELRQALDGKISVFLGKSGVGKTSLLNAIQPGLGLRVNAVNQVTGKGRHTTTYQEMFRLERGGAIVDTPGEREFGLWNVDEQDLALFFPEMRPYLGKCRFGVDCRHDEEPGCAVRKAVTSGLISHRRYTSYMRLLEE